MPVAIQLGTKNSHVWSLKELESRNMYYGLELKEKEYRNIDEKYGAH